MYEDRGGGLAPRQLTAMRCAAELDSNAGGGEDDRVDQDDRDGSSDEEEEMDTRGLGGAFDRWYVRVLPAQAVSTAVMGPNTHLKVRRERDGKETKEREEGRKKRLKMEGARYRAVVEDDECMKHNNPPPPPGYSFNALFVPS
jgi:hypothetical protein